MILKTIDQKIRKAFSGAAIHYDILTSLHKEIGRDLMKKAMAVEPSQNILDVGMGTGWLTSRLTHYFPGSMVVGVDFAPGMIEIAKNQNEEGFKIIEAHTDHLPFKDEAFDLVISNLAYHWVNDLVIAFGQCRAKLKKTGSLYITLCGRRTFEELFVALENTREIEGKEIPLPIRRLDDVETIERSLRQSGFREIEVKAERIKIRFPDMMSLVKWSKSIGANVLDKDIYIGKEWLAKANDYYDQHYKDNFGIYATFEVIWIKAIK